MLVKVTFNTYAFIYIYIYKLFVYFKKNQNILIRNYKQSTLYTYQIQRFAYCFLANLTF